MSATSYPAREEAVRLNADGLKRCSRCDEVKGHSAFSRASASWDGLNYRCRDCLAHADAEARDRRRTRWALEDPYANASPKRCPDCKGERPRQEFGTNPTRADGLQSICKECMAARASSNRAQNRGRWGGGHPYSDQSAKLCGGCRQIRPRADFSTNPSRYDGLDAVCRGCAAARSSARRARILGQWVEDVDRDVAWELAGGTCYLCNEPVPRDRFDLDHVDPIVNGGEHSYFNTAPTHVSCNRSKNGTPWPDVAFDPNA